MMGMKSVPGTKCPAGTVTLSFGDAELLWNCQTQSKSHLAPLQKVETGFFLHVRLWQNSRITIVLKQVLAFALDVSGLARDCQTPAGVHQDPQDLVFKAQADQ